MTKVAVLAPAPGLARNAMFEGRRVDSGAHHPNTHWMDGFMAVARKAPSRGIAIATSDVLPVEHADIAVHMVFADPRLAAQQKRARPGLKTMLVLLETALGAAYTANPRNHEHFDAVVTYDERLVDGRKYFLMRPRAYDRSRIRTGAPFSERRVACLVGTNRQFRLRSGLFLPPRGWRLSLRDWSDYVCCPGQLITYRAAVGRAAATRPERDVDIYGEGWDDDAATRATCKGVPRESTLHYAGRYRYYLALENHASAYSLISERIWDALWADTVPVYAGNTRIARHVPAACFVDARAFASPAMLLDALARTDERTWLAQRQAGRDFITGAGVEPFLPEAFADEFLRVLQHLASARV